MITAQPVTVVRGGSRWRIAAQAPRRTLPITSLMKALFYLDRLGLFDVVFSDQFVP